MGHPTKVLEENTAESYTDCVYGGLAQEALDANNSKWAKENFCEIQAKNVAAVALVLKLCLGLNSKVIDSETMSQIKCFFVHVALVVMVYYHSNKKP